MTEIRIKGLYFVNIILSELQYQDIGNIFVT